ncbi:MAG: tetratricopeptide repeat protein, partial [candidate division Zixibacteria bacterium]
SPKTPEAAEAYYRLGLIYQNDIYDLEKAKVSFSKAQTENPSSEFRNLALARSAQIAKLESYRIQLQRADSIRAADQSGARSHGDTPDTLTSAEILGKDLIGPEEARDSSFSEPGMSEGMEKDDSATEREEEIFTVPIETAGENIDAIDSTEIASAPGEDSVEVDIGEFYTVPLDSLNGTLVTLDRAGTADTTAGQDSMSTGNLGIPESGRDEISLEDSVRAAQAARREQVRQDKITQDSIRQEITKRGIETRFLLAELYAYELNRPDSALREYVLIADQHPNSEYALRALLASAFLEFDGGDSTVAEEYLYRLIENYPRSPQAAAAAQMLSHPMDLSLNGAGLYCAAESLAYDGNTLDSAITLFRYITDNFPELAPKAFYAVAWALDRHQEEEDSSAFHAYKFVREQYPQSVYATAAEVRMGLMAKPRERRVSPPSEEKREEIEKDKPDYDSLRMTARGLPSAPAVKELSEFVYPQSLLNRRLKGEVLFKIKINLFGKVQEYEIIGPSGEYAIDSAATAALLETEFETSDLDFSKLDMYYKYVIGFERPDINIFNDPYIEERRRGP